MSMDYTAVAAPSPGYPVRFDVEYPEGLSRWLIFVKWLLAIPLRGAGLPADHQPAVLPGCLFAILFTRNSAGAPTSSVNVYRWQANVTAATA
jgi:hypothetical protein